MIIEVSIRNDDLSGDELGVGFHLEDDVIDKAPDRYKFVGDYIAAEVERLFRQYNKQQEK